MTNAELWDAIRGQFPSFASHTSKATAETFTERGFETLMRTDVDALNEFFTLSVRVKLLDIKASQAVNDLEAAGFGESYNVPFGGIIQRMTINAVKPVSPAYRGLKDGDSVDPYVVRKPVARERFFQQNFDYQSWLTMPDEDMYKQIFISENGMSEFATGIMQALQNGYIVQQYENELEAINRGFLNATKYPMKDTQKLVVSLSATPTDDELRAFVLAVNNMVSAMKLGPQTDAFNAYGFNSHQDVSRLKLLLRPGIVSAIKNIPALNAPGLGLPIDVIEVPNFGGIEYYSDKTLATRLYPHYDTAGAQDGWSKTDGGDLYTGTIYTKDTNAKTLGIIADKGLVLHGIQSPYRVEPARNARGLYTNYWASSPNNTIAVDPIYNAVAIQKE